MKGKEQIWMQFIQRSNGIRYDYCPDYHPRFYDDINNTIAIFRVKLKSNPKKNLFQKIYQWLIKVL